MKPSDSQRTNAFRWPSLLPMQRTTTAPTRGRSQERVSNGLSPQVIPKNHDDAEKHRTGVRSDRPGLETAQHTRAISDDGACAIDGAVDKTDIDTTPKGILRQRIRGIDDHGVVHLVHVVLVQQQPVK